MLCVKLGGQFPCGSVTRSLVAGGEILETAVIEQAYHEGRGSITVRGKVHIEGDQAASTAAAAASSSTESRSKVKVSRKSGSGRPQIIITELPYQSNKVRRPVAAVVEASVL